MTCRGLLAIIGRGVVLRGALAALGAASCSGPPDAPRFLFKNPPPYGGGDAGTAGALFRPVSDALELHCSTLDCHGAPARNLRLFGAAGVRLDPRGLVGKSLTTDKEYEANYESIIAIQPEVLNTIVAQRGVRPERWLVITKGRGTEHHKGEVRMIAGDDTDRCVTSWLTGTLDTKACENAASVSPPMGVGFNAVPP